MIQVHRVPLRGTALRLAQELSQAPERGCVNWSGGNFQHPTEATLNALSRTDKLWQLRELEGAGVSVPEFSLTPLRGFLPRRIFHQQGRDFTNPPRRPDFWVRPVNIREEWRLHFFKTKKGNLKLLRSGKKVPRSLHFHPWVRSHRLGWKISYIGGAPEVLVSASRKAVEALRLDFGAVDVGVEEAPDGMLSPVVLEVNTAPGLDSGTLALYASSARSFFS